MTRVVTRRRFLASLTGMVGATLLAACSGGGSTPSPTAAKAPASSGGAAPQPTQAPASSGSSGTGGAGKLEIFSWWTSPGEVEALDALYKVHAAKAPGVEIINAALAGGAGAGGNMKAVLQTRMLANNPPDSFQVHLGKELIDGHVKAGRMEPIDDIYKSEGFDKAFPKDLLDIASYDGHPWSVPVNIHRGNVMWYHKKILADVGAQPPETLDEFFALGDKVKAKGIALIALGESRPIASGRLFESILISVLGVDGYRGLWNGKTVWTDAKITDALNQMKRVYDYCNPDYLSVDPSDQGMLVINGKSATEVVGDWRNGFFKQKGFKDYGWAPFPGTSGTYDIISDSFGLPKNAPHRDNAIAWLKVCGSIQGQDAFNPIKGSIPARVDAGMANYNEYQKQAMESFKKDKLVPSVCDGAAAKDSWITDFVNAMNVFAANRDVAATQKRLLQAAKDAGVA